MAKQNLTKEKEQIVFGNDSVVIQKYISGIKGGRTLDMTGYPFDVLNAGHVVITNGSGTYKPMPVVGTTVEGVTTYAYGTLPANHSYAGVLYRSILTKEPAASIMTNGEVNSEAVPYAMTSILSAFKAACPQIVFIKDEEA